MSHRTSHACLRPAKTAEHANHHSIRTNADALQVRAPVSFQHFFLSTFRAWETRVFARRPEFLSEIADKRLEMSRKTDKFRENVFRH